MPVKAGVWENADFLRELSLALFQVASGGGALSTQAKSAVEVYLKAQGHDQSWESIRMPSAPNLYLFSLYPPLPCHTKSLQSKSIASLIMPEKSSRRWDAAAHETLLFAMIEEFRPNKESITAIVNRLRAMGHDYTFHGVNQHIQKLRKARDTSALDGSGDSSKPATPRKATPRKTPTSTRKHKMEMEEEADELGRNLKNEDDKGSMATPSKRPKIE
ncbi:hypothetical protein MY11210_002613 [Beauveria gryllotalpidicola]